MVETATLTIEEVRDQERFNLRRWVEVCADPALAALEYRIETDRHGNVIMSPPPGFDHGDFQSQIAFQLRLHTQGQGKSVTECPISTSEGIRAADVAWISLDRLARAKKKNVLTIAPEICVEVLSPSNVRGEIEEKKRLYFEAGAEEVWVCDLQGHLFVYMAKTPGEACESLLCPACPQKIEG